MERLWSPKNYLLENKFIRAVSIQNFFGYRYYFSVFFRCIFKQKVPMQVNHSPGYRKLPNWVSVAAVLLWRYFGKSFSSRKGSHWYPGSIFSCTDTGPGAFVSGKSVFGILVHGIFGYSTDTIKISTLIISFMRPLLTASSASTHWRTAFFKVEVLKRAAWATYLPAMKGATPILLPIALLS